MQISMFKLRRIAAANRWNCTQSSVLRNFPRHIDFFERTFLDSFDRMLTLTITGKKASTRFTNMENLAPCSHKIRTRAISKNALCHLSIALRSYELSERSCARLLLISSFCDLRNIQRDCHVKNEKKRGQSTTQKMLILKSNALSHCVGAILALKIMRHWIRAKEAKKPDERQKESRVKQKIILITMRNVHVGVPLRTRHICWVRCRLHRGLHSVKFQPKKHLIPDTYDTRFLAVAESEFTICTRSCRRQNMKHSHRH